MLKVFYNSIYNGFKECPNRTLSENIRDQLAIQLLETITGYWIYTVIQLIGYGVTALALGPYSVIISFSSSYYNDYDAGGRVLPLDHY